MTRRVASALVVWCLVVVAGGVAVWLVISRVGNEVTDPTAMVVQPTSAGAPRTGPDRGQRSGGTHRPKPSATHTSRPPTGGPSAGASSTSPPPASSPTTTQSPQPPPVTARAGTWQGTAGLVRVTCRGPSISLTGASPAPGWHISIGSRGPAAVEVELEKQEGERHTQVRAVCSGGSPRFTVHNAGEGDR